MKATNKANSMTDLTSKDMPENTELTQELEEEIQNYSDVEVIEADTENDEDDEVDIPIVYQELEELKSLCSQSGLTTTQLLTYEDLEGFTGIQQHIRLIESRLGVPQREADKDVFIKVSANKDGFQGFRYPDIGLVDGVICAVFHNHIQPIEAVLKTCKTLKILRNGQGTSAEYYLTLGEQQAEYLPMRMSVKTSDQTHNEFQMIKVKYLQGVLNNYTFARTWLGDGTYKVTDFKSVDGRFLIGTIEGKQYYLSQSQFDNLKTNESDGRPTNLIIEGYRTYLKEGKPITVRNEYIEGHRPSMFFSECMETIIRQCTKNGHFGDLTMDNPHALVQKYLNETSNGNLEPKLIELITSDLVMMDAAMASKLGKGEKKNTKARRSFKIEPGVEIFVKGITSCKPSTANRWGFQLLLEYGGINYTTIPNSAIAEARSNNLFANLNFNDPENPVQLVITEIEYWETVKQVQGQPDVITINKKYVLKWVTPLKAQQRNPKYNNLAAKLSKKAQ